MTLKQKLVKGGMWGIGATVLVGFLAYLFRFILIKNLPIEDYGLYYSIVTIFLFTTTFIDMGRSISYLKYSAPAIANKKKGLWKGFILNYFRFKIKSGSIFVLLVIILSGFLAQHYFKDPRAGALFIILGIIYAISDIFFNYTATLFESVHDQKSRSIHESLKIILQVGILILSLLLGFGIWSPVIAVGIGSLLASGVFYIIFYKKYFPDFFKIASKPATHLSKAIASFGYANVFFLIGAYILNYTDTYMLIYFTTLTEVGLYNVAVPTARTIIILATPVTVLLLPVVAYLLAKKMGPTLNVVINSIYKYTFAAFLPLMLILVSYSSLILQLLFSSEYTQASTPMVILSISAIFSIFFGINSHIINGIGKPKVNVYLIIGATVFNIILNFLLIPKYGMNGASVATLAGYILMCIISFIYINTQLKDVRISWAHFLKSFFAGVVFILAVNFLKQVLLLPNVWLESIIVLGISGLIYLGMIFLTKNITVKEIKDLMLLAKKR